MWFKFTTIHVPGKLDNGPDYMSRHSGGHNDTSQEDGSLAGQCIEVWRVSTYGQKIDDALVASMKVVLSHSEGLRAVTFDRVRGATRKDPELMRRLDALLTTHYREKLPENLERFERYRKGLSVLDGTVMYHSGGHSFDATGESGLPVSICGCSLLFHQGEDMADICRLFHRMGLSLPL